MVNLIEHLAEGELLQVRLLLSIGIDLFLGSLLLERSLDLWTSLSLTFFLGFEVLDEL